MSILAVGDICLGDHYFSLGHGTGARSSTNGIASFFSEVKQLLPPHDIIIGNLESPLSERSSITDDIEGSVFLGKPAYAPELKALGFNVLHIANNHILQHGQGPFNDTINALKQAGIQPLGLVGEDGFYSKPVIQNTEHGKYVILGYSVTPERYMPDQLLYAEGAPANIKSDIEKASKLGDYLIVSIHGGLEGSLLPDTETITLYKQIIEWGSDIVLGHHPHTFQPVEQYRQGLIAYSLGDFIFDLFWDKNLVTTAALSIAPPQDKDGEHNFKLMPIEFHDDYILRFLDNKQADEFLTQLSLRSKSMASTDYEHILQKEISRSLSAEKPIKVFYILKHILKGKTGLKIKFFLRKLKNLL